MQQSSDRPPAPRAAGLNQGKVPSADLGLVISPHCPLSYCLCALLFFSCVSSNELIFVQGLFESGLK